jgi:predicted TIM-barrel fold metal-dependent hydrolase
MQEHETVYADISAISNPDILPPAQFAAITKALLEAGLEDRLMFGSDNGDINKIVAAVNALAFLSPAQKEKIFYRNAERFFSAGK